MQQKAGSIVGLGFAAMSLLPAAVTPVAAQSVAAPSVSLPEVDVEAAGKGGYDPAVAYASKARTGARKADIGPLGDVSIKDTPHAVTVVPQDVLVNQGVEQVNDALRFLPSVEIRDQQGFDISRPQSRGFQGSIVQNTRMDGLNVVGTTAIAAENLQSIQVLNGPSGALFGPETPAGVFDYVLKRPTDLPLFRYIEGFDSRGVFTEWIDACGRTGPDNRIGYRINLVHGQGEEYVKSSYETRTLGSLALDYHFDYATVLETNYSHYAPDSTGLPGAIVYDGASTAGSKSRSTQIPNGLNPLTPGLGQPGAGVNLRSDTGIVKLKHDFNADWHLEIGGLYEGAERNLYGISNTLSDNAGDYTVTKNFNAVSLFTVASNSAYLNGKVDFLGTRNDVTIGTNGYALSMYNPRVNPTLTLGNSNLADPTVFFPTAGAPNTQGNYYSGYLRNQSLITGDTIHFNDKVAVQGVLSTAFLSSASYALNGSVTSADKRDFALSPTTSLILTPTNRLTGYFTYAGSVEQGDTAPTGSANANVTLAPYHDELYEVGVKYQLTPGLLVTLDGFRMTRPYATQDATTDIFAVVGTQRNYGIELFGQGALTPDLSLLGGITFIDARLQNSGVVATDNKLIVGVPKYKLDQLFDFHPFYFHGGALTAAVHYEDARAATNTNMSYADGFVSVDLGARYSTNVGTHHATFRFQVLNVNDARYYISVADGNIVGSPGANTAYLGAPRTYHASLELDF